jgi:hypothetical protein
MDARLHHSGTASAVSLSPDDRFAVEVLRDGVWTILAGFPTREAARQALTCSHLLDDAYNAAPFEDYGVREIAPATPALPAGDLHIDLDIPDGNYRRADPLAVFAVNAERRAIEDSRFDNCRMRQWMAREGD